MLALYNRGPKLLLVLLVLKILNLDSEGVEELYVDKVCEVKKEFISGFNICFQISDLTT